MKQYDLLSVATVVTLALACVALSACGGGSGGGDASSKPLLEQQPTIGTNASAAASAASATEGSEPASAPESASSASTPGSAAAGSQSSTSTAGSPEPTTPATTQPNPATVVGSGKDSAAGTSGEQAAPPKSTSGTAPNQSGEGQSGEASGPKVTAGAETAASSPSTVPNCVIDQTRYFGGSCWANVKDTVPSGSNRDYSNARLNHTGSVNANCIAGKVNWSTGLCKSTTTPADAAAALDASRPSGSSYKIGAFYFPGWRENQAGAPAKYPWARLKSYPEREPLLGWYDDGNVATVEQQLKWMRTYGIDYVVFDWYWNGKGAYLKHSLDAYFKTESRKDIPFTLLWANHTSTPQNKLEFTSMVDFWINNYFGRPEFMKIDGKPVIFIFSHVNLIKQAGQFDLSVASLLTDAESRARTAGYKGIYFVGGTHVDSNLLKSASASGYSALSGYNYHGRAEDSSISYEELDSAYHHVWNEVLKNSNVPYIIPMTQGWDRRPWGGSPNPLHDLSGGTASGFERHLREARRLMDANPTKTMRMGVICCWNEFGEGSFIEPTKRDGFLYLEKVQKIFGAP